MKFPYTITGDNITVFCDGQLIKMPRTHSGFKAMAEHLQGAVHDADTIKTLSDKTQALTRLSAGKVTVIGNTVYYKGVPVRSALTERLIKLTDEGYDATPWALFMDKVMQNPSENSKERLFQFLERWEAPLTPDGNFVAFKGVREDYTDVHTGTMDNSPGQTVSMPREKVVEDPNVTCASGLHACASHYLDNFWGNRKLIAVEIDPKDVVSIPVDYNLSKMRVCRYVVIGDIEDLRHRDRIETAQVVDQNEYGRVVAVPPEPLVLGARVAGEVVEHEGLTYVPADDDFEYGDLVVTTDGTDRVGVVVHRGEITYQDHEHPDHEQWYHGEVAGEDIDPMEHAIVVFGVEPEVSFTWFEKDIWPLDRLDLLDDVEEDDARDGEEEDEGGDSLTFEHESTGRIFDAAALIAGVREIGQRGFSRKFGVPRTTLQDWLRRAQEAGY